MYASKYVLGLAEWPQSRRGTALSLPSRQGLNQDSDLETKEWSGHLIAWNLEVLQRGSGERPKARDNSRK